MVKCIIEEIRIQNLFKGDPEISTIYFGGGTPSLLSYEELCSIIEMVRKKYTVDSKAEVTLEVNPDDVDPMRLREWLKAGITRLSVGIQTFNDEELRWMNRAHDSNRAINCLKEIKDAGFINFSADLIYGSPFLTTEALKKNVDLMLDHNVPHLSCYALTVEKNTVLKYQIDHKKSAAVNDQHQSDQFLWLMNNLPLHGYEQYEISNFSKAGFESKHNSSYWNGVPYYGFGPSAHSFNGKEIRRWNVANNAMYVKAVRSNIPFYEEEILTEIQQVNEFIMISLRTSTGLSIQTLSERFGKQYNAQIMLEAEKYINLNHLNKKGNILQLTNEGKIFADGIAANLFI